MSCRLVGLVLDPRGIYFQKGYLLLYFTLHIQKGHFIITLLFDYHIHNGA